MSPFNLNDDSLYQRWRDAKLKNYPQKIDQLMIEVKDIARLSAAEHQALVNLCKKTNMALYHRAVPLNSKDHLKDICATFGLKNLDKNLYADDDGISALIVTSEKRQYDYIPYSDKPIRWHTDGYYNKLENSIRAMVLHCENPSLSGGDNQLLDHEIVYILIREESPQFIQALMAPDVMTIPANIEQGVEIRPEQTGPVFSVDPQSGDLHMRYTARTKSIEWKQDSGVQQAVRFLEHLLSSDMPYIYRYRLQANEGVLSNNVLHGRSKIENGDAQDQHRVMYRARYYERVSGTGVKVQ
jgi:alpha-ketoglutarate-dependent taurine dioxygenase